MKNCYTCKHAYEVGYSLYCEIEVEDNRFMLDCEHAECYSWDGEEE
ncbi:hypothetical protein [Cetobacterium sp.]